jgi:hypothetical protein
MPVRYSMGPFSDIKCMDPKSYQIMYDDYAGQYNDKEKELGKTASAESPQKLTGFMLPGDEVRPGGDITSLDGSVILKNVNGDLMEYTNNGAPQKLWFSGTPQIGSTLVFDKSGDLCLQTGRNLQTVWCTRTGTKDCPGLMVGSVVLGDDGNLKVVDAYGQWLWRNNASKPFNGGKVWLPAISSFPATGEKNIEACPVNISTLKWNPSNVDAGPLTIWQH